MTRGVECSHPKASKPSAEVRVKIISRQEIIEQRIPISSEVKCLGARRLRFRHVRDTRTSHVRDTRTSGFVWTSDYGSLISALGHNALRLAGSGKDRYDEAGGGQRHRAQVVAAVVLLPLFGGGVEIDRRA